MTFALTSQQVSWSDVHAFVFPKLQRVGDWPMLGSPAWCELDDRDPIKWASVLDGGQHWALRVEYLQTVLCDASSDISAAENWSEIARVIKNRNDYFAARPWMNRRAG